jgi:hypothetical protein
MGFYAGILLLTGTTPGALYLPLASQLAAIGVHLSALALFRPSPREIMAVLTLQPPEVHRARVIKPQVVGGVEPIGDPVGGTSHAAQAVDMPALPSVADLSRPVVMLLVVAALLRAVLIVVDAAILIPVCVSGQMHIS